MEIKDILKNASRYYAQYLSELTPKEMDNSSYEKLINEFLDPLVQLPINTFYRTFFQALDEYVGIMRREQDLQELLSQPDPFLTNLEWAMDTIVKEHKYHRLKSFSDLNDDRDLASAIAEAACQLQFDSAVDFFGELAGASILMYPFEAIRLFETAIQSSADWIENDSDYVYALRRLFDYEIEEWRK